MNHHNGSMERDQLIALNSQGLIPGPGEEEGAFLLRVEAVQENFKNEKDAIPPQHWTWAGEQLKKFFDFSPTWCSATYSSKGLTPWQAAATWIDVNRIYTIQIRRARWVSWLIDPNEILAHEAVHAARAAFEEPYSEEIFAYLTSRAKWRKVLGPFFQKPIESLFLMGIVMAGAILESSLCYAAALILTFVWSLRLTKARLRVKRAGEKSIPFLRDPGLVGAFLFRLTDEEIASLARGKELIPKKELRWDLLREKYLKEGLWQN
jgi:hypothetical protein